MRFLGCALSFVVGAPALTDGESSSDQRDDERRGDSSDESAEPADASLFDDELRVGAITTGQQERPFALAWRHRLVVDPALELLQSSTRHQQVDRSTCCVPFGGGRLQASLDEQGLATLGDPSSVPRPLAEERLVGDLDRLAAAHRVVVEREQPERPEAETTSSMMPSDNPSVSSSLRPARRRVSSA